MGLTLLAIGLMGLWESFFEGHHEGDAASQEAAAVAAVAAAAASDGEDAGAGERGDG